MSQMITYEEISDPKRKWITRKYKNLRQKLRIMCLEKNILMTAFSIYPFTRSLSDSHLPFEMFGVISISWTKGALKEIHDRKRKWITRKYINVRRRMGVLWYGEGYPDDRLLYLSLQSFPVDAWNPIIETEKMDKKKVWKMRRRLGVMCLEKNILMTAFSIYPSTHSSLDFYYLSRCLGSYHEPKDCMQGADPSGKKKSQKRGGNSLLLDLEKNILVSAFSI